MEITTTAPPDVQAAPQRPRRRAARPAVSTSTPKDNQKKIRQDGRVAVTVLMSPELDELLGWTARADGVDRSVLASKLISSGLARRSALAREAADRIEALRAALAKSDASDVDKGSASRVTPVESEATDQAA